MFGKMEHECIFWVTTVTLYMESIKCKNVPKVVWDSMSREQQLQVMRLCGQQCIKHAARQFNTEAQIAAHETQFRSNSHPKMGDVVTREDKTTGEAEWGRNKSQLGLIYHATIVLCKKFC